MIKRLHDWSLANVEGNFDADVRWRRSDGRQFGRLVQFDDMARIVTLISATSDEERQSFILPGILIGADLQTRTFHFVQPNGGAYRGSLSEYFPTGPKVELPSAYLASITRISTVNYASGRETERFELDHLQRQ